MSHVSYRNMISDKRHDTQEASAYTPLVRIPLLYNKDG
jgi:hypothetical protein